MYEIRYGYPDGVYKIVKTDLASQAYRLYDHVREYAIKHGLPWSIALFDRGWKIKSERIE